MPHARTWIVAAACVAAACVAAVAVAMRHARASRPITDLIAEGSELDVAFSYDAATGVIAFGTDSGEPGLWELPAGADALRRLPVEGIFVRHPELSPGARWIAFHALDVDRRSWEHRLLLLNRATQTARVVRETGDDEFVSRTAFSPDGKRLAYELIHHRHDGSWADELRVVDVDSARDGSLVAEPGVSARGPGWSRDGRALYFVSDRCLRVVPAAGGPSRVVGCADSAVASSSPPEPVAVSPDGGRVAFTLEHEGCAHIAVAEVAAGSVRLIDRDECAAGPRFVDDHTLAYVGQLGNGSRVPRIRRLDAGGAARTLGFPEGITYAVAPTGDGRVLALLGAPGLPRSIWSLDAGGGAPRLRYSPLDAARLGELGPLPRHEMVRSRDALAVPVRIFPGVGPSPRPAVLFVHPGVGGRDDVAARVYPEIGYLTALGYTVVAPNYRGSTGYGPAFGKRADDLDGKLDDLDAAVELLRGRPEIDATRLAIFGSCYGNGLVPSLLERRPGLFRAVIAWVGPPMPWLSAPPSQGELPLLWINGRFERGTEQYGRVAAEARGEGHRVTFVELDESHWLLHAANRARALRTIGRFLGEALVAR